MSSLIDERYKIPTAYGIICWCQNTSDREFSVNVETGGVVITLDGCADLALAVELARELATFGGASTLVVEK